MAISEIISRTGKAIVLHRSGELQGVIDDDRAQRPALPGEVIDAVNRSSALLQGPSAPLVSADRKILSEVFTGNNDPIVGLAIQAYVGVLLPDFQRANVDNIAMSLAGSALDRANTGWHSALDEIGVNADAVNAFLMNEARFYKELGRDPNANIQIARQRSFTEFSGKADTEAIRQIYDRRISEGYINVLAAQSALRAITSLISSTNDKGHFLSTEDAMSFANGIVDVILDPSKYEKYTPPSYEGRIGEIRKLLEFITVKSHKPDFEALGRGGFLYPTLLDFLQRDPLMRAQFLESIAVLLSSRVLQDEVSSKEEILMAPSSQRSRESLEGALQKEARKSSVHGVDGKLYSVGDAREQWQGRVDELNRFLNEITTRLAISTSTDRILIDPQTVASFQDFASLYMGKTRSDKAGQSQLFAQDLDGNWYLSDISSLHQISHLRDKAATEVLKLDRAYSEMSRRVINSLLQDGRVRAEDKAILGEIDIKSSMQRILEYLLQLRSTNLMTAENTLYGILQSRLALDAVAGTFQIQDLGDAMARQLEQGLFEAVQEFTREREQVKQLVDKINTP